MALSDDEKKMLAELQAKEQEPDADHDYEIEVYDTTAGKGARIPFATGKKWLFETFGIGDAPASPETTGESGGAGGDAPPTGTAGTKKPNAGYFGRKS